MMLLLQDRPVSAISSTEEAYSAFFQPFLMSSTYTGKNRPCFRCNEQAFPTRLFYSSWSHFELLRAVFPTRGVQVDVRTSFAQEEPLDLQCLTMIQGLLSLEDVSIDWDILTLEFLSNSGASSIFHLGVGGCCVCCLSCTVRSCNDIHHCCGRHLCEHSIRASIVFHKCHVGAQPGLRT